MPRPDSPKTPPNITEPEDHLIDLVKKDNPFSKILHEQFELMNNKDLKGWALFDHVYKIATLVKGALNSRRLPLAKISQFRRDEMLAKVEEVLKNYESTRQTYNETLKTGKIVPPDTESLMKMVGALVAYDTTRLKKEHPDNKEIEESQKAGDKVEDKAADERRVAEEKAKEDAKKAQRKANEERMIRYSKLVIVPPAKEYADQYNDPKCKIEENIKRRDALMPISLEKATEIVKEACKNQKQECPSTPIEQAKILMNELFSLGKERVAEADGESPLFQQAGRRLENEIVPALVRIVGEDLKLFMDEKVHLALKTIESGIKDPYIRAPEAGVKWSDTVDLTTGAGQLKNAFNAYVSPDAAPKDISFLFAKREDRSVGKNTEGDKSKPRGPAGGGAGYKA